MPAAQYDLVFLGEVFEGTDPQTAQARLAQRFGLTEANAERMFAGGRVVVKRCVDAATAKRYRDAFAQAGARLRVATAGATAAPARTPAAAPASPATTASPAATAAAATTASSVETPGLTLAPLGAPLDEIDDRGPPQSPDIGRLALVPGDDWTLLDCAPPSDNLPLPDISHLRLEPIATVSPRDSARD